MCFISKCLKFKFVETQTSWVGNKCLTVVIFLIPLLVQCFFLLVVLNLYDQLQSVENSAALHFRHAVAPSCFMFMYLTFLRRDPSVNTENLRHVSLRNLEKAAQKMFPSWGTFFSCRRFYKHLPKLNSDLKHGRVSGIPWWWNIDTADEKPVVNADSVVFRLNERRGL